MDVSMFVILLSHTHTRRQNQDNSKVTNEKSAAGAKCDYHTLNSVFEVLKTLDL